MEIDFEKNMEMITGIVQRLEKGQLSLEEALKAFEQGIQLTQKCEEYLLKAENRVKLLVSSQGDDAVTKPFETE